MGRVALRFQDDQIRISTDIVKRMGNPSFIHIFFDRNGKKLYVRSCTMDQDAFPINREAASHAHTGLAICSKDILMMLADVMHVGYPSDMVICRHAFVDSTTIAISLDDYEFVSQDSEEEDE